MLIFIHFFVTCTKKFVGPGMILMGRRMWTMMKQNSKDILKEQEKQRHHHVKTTLCNGVLVSFK